MPYFPPVGGGVLLPNSIDDTFLADMPAGTVKGRGVGAGAGDPQNIALPLSYRNILGRNGGMEVWQRGAGGSAAWSLAASTQQYVADGWFIGVGANQQTQISQTAGITTGSRYAIFVSRNSGQAGVAACALEFPLDSDEIATMRGSIVTLSFSALAGANWSPAGGLMTAIVAVGTGAPARALAGFTGQVNVIAATAALVAATTRFTFTSAAVVPANATQASVFLTWIPVGTAGGSDAFILDDVQLEIGSVATPFERRPFEQELLACRRHFWKSFPYGTVPAQASVPAGAFYFSATKAGAVADIFAQAEFAVPMRNVPTMTGFSVAIAGAQVTNLSRSGNCSATSFSVISEQSAIVACTGHASGVVGDYLAIHYIADAGI